VHNPGSGSSWTRITPNVASLVSDATGNVFILGSSPEFVGKLLAFRPPICPQGRNGKYCLLRRGVMRVSVT
jgi:hypothetical protein